MLFGGMFSLAFAENTESITIQLLEKDTQLPVVATVLCGEYSVISTDRGIANLPIGVEKSCAFLEIRSNHHYPFSISTVDIEKMLSAGADTVMLVIRPLKEQETVLVEEQRSPAHGQSYGMDSETLRKTPGGFDDAIRLLQALPGSVSTREYGQNAGQVILRGANPNESRLYIDGVEVPYLYHFQQYASILPTKLVDNVIMYPSNFGSSYGDATGGIIAIESKEANEQEKTLSVQANLIMVGVQATTPLEKGVLSLSMRRSFADLYESGNEQYSLWPRFSDYVARYDIRNAQGHHFRWTAIGSQDHYGRYIYDADDLDPYQRSVNPNLDKNRRFDGGVFRWDWRSPEYRARTSVALMRDDWKASIASDSQQRLDRYSWLRHESIVIRDNKELSVGFDQRLGLIHQQVDTQSPYPVVYADAPLLAKGQSVDNALWEWRQGTWVEPRVNIGTWRIIGGLRSQWLPLQSQVAIDPRLQIYKEMGTGLLAHVGVGRYSQSPQVESGLSHFAQSNQVSGGMQWQPRRNSASKLGFDLWYKSTENKAYQPVDGDIILVSEEATGGEVFWNTTWFDALQSNVSLSSVSSHLFSDGQRYVSPFSQPIYFNAMIAWQNAHWNLGARYRYASGLPFAAPESSLYQASADNYQALWSTFPTDKMPDYQKVDVQIARNIKWKEWNIRAYCEAWYVPAVGNYLYPIYNFDYSESQLVVGPAFVPLLGINIDR
jgi:hypothetical protein